MSDFELNVFPSRRFESYRRFLPSSLPPLSPSESRIRWQYPYPPLNLSYRTVSPLRLDRWIPYSDRPTPNLADRLDIPSWRDGFIFEESRRARMTFPWHFVPPESRGRSIHRRPYWLSPRLPASLRPRSSSRDSYVSFHELWSLMHPRDFAAIRDSRSGDTGYVFPFPNPDTGVIQFDLPLTRYRFMGSARAKKIIRAIARFIRVDWKKMAGFLGFVEEKSFLTFKEGGELEFDLRDIEEKRKQEWEGEYKLPITAELTRNGIRLRWIIWAIARLFAKDEIVIARFFGLVKGDKERLVVSLFFE
ncbi:MAG: hypothetical protein LQ352_008098 [Teloschistes flavicans]|nr:MAG: hypothetical protein LQ352_008098 [Teloschistes flavicans]